VGAHYGTVVLCHGGELHRVGPNCATWPSVLTWNLYQRPGPGPRFGPTLFDLCSAVDAFKLGVPHALLAGYIAAGSAPAAEPEPPARAGLFRPGRYSHSDTLYILFVILHTKYTGRPENDVNVYA
jgi:hypothetical protein